MQLRIGCQHSCQPIRSHIRKSGGISVGIHFTHKYLEAHGRVLSTIATDDLVLKHKFLSIHSAD